MSSAVAGSRDAFDRWGERLADRANPIVVKELRQGLRTRVFWVFFALMLVGCAAISLISFAVVSDGSLDAGKGAFIAFFFCLAGVQFFVIPYSAYRSMSREAEEETWVLLTLTGLGPRKILMGKMTSYFAQGVLYSSACAPFLLFSYYLNGIDLPSIVVSLLLALAWQLFLTSASVSVATLAESRIVRAVLHFVVLGGLFQGASMGFGGAIAIAENLSGFVATDAFWVSLMSVLFVTVTTAVLLFEMAAARLALVSENYARGPRLALTVQALGGTLLFVWGSLASGEFGVLVVGACVMSAYLFAVGGLISSDIDGMRRSHSAGGARWQLFLPGALRGFTLVTLLQVLTGVVFAGLLMNNPHTEDKGLAVALGAPLFSLLFLSLPNLMSRWVPHLPDQLPALTRLFGIGVFIFGVGVPLLIGTFTGEPGGVVVNLLNPVWGLVNMASSDDWPFQLSVVAGAAAVMWVFAFASLRRRDAEPTA